MACELEITRLFSYLAVRADGRSADAFGDGWIFGFLNKTKAVTDRLHDAFNQNCKECIRLALTCKNQ
ncbi:hypothetical protein AAK899_09350 [Erysipelotrichaceae bacterium 51-3]